MVYLQSVKDVTTFGKLIGLLLFCLPLLLSINMYTKKTRNELARLGMGTIFLVSHKYMSKNRQNCVAQTRAYSK